MYQIMIVDDEVHTVEGIYSGVDWDKLGITAVFKAFTVRSAKQRFELDRIDIMLCDIEMPQATGLELAEWVREHYPETKIIFLTCHADFKYAKQALQLGSIDYILKPVPFRELEKVIEKAKETINKESEIVQYSQFWIQNQPMIIERFWQDILNLNIPSNARAISRAAAERNIPYFDEMVFVPILISLQRWHKPVNLRDEKILEYGLKNSAEEVIFESRQDRLLITLSNRKMLAILAIRGNDAPSSEYEAACRRFIEACSKYFYCDISCYIGEKVHGHEMLEMVNKLYEMERNNVAFNNSVLLLSRPKVQTSNYQSADMTLWSVMLKEDKFDEVWTEAKQYLEGVEKEKLSADLLNRFYQDFQQMIHYVLHTKGIHAHLLFGDPQSKELNANAIRSVSYLMEWMRHLVTKAKEYVHTLQQSQSVVEKVKELIKLRISEDISREEIANHVFLNPDHLTRIFKKETGMAMWDYLFQERMQLAQELLAKSDMPISAVASHIGHSNFSHFSRAFKKHTTMNPNEYRQLHRHK